MTTDFNLKRLSLSYAREIDPSLFEISADASSMLNSGLPDYTQFPATSYAYVLTDRPVRYKGELIESQTVAKDISGQMYFDLIPNSFEDNGTEFNYIVSMYGPQAQLIHRIKIEMPDEDSLVWDLVPVETVPSYQSPTELLPI